MYKNEQAPHHNSHHIKWYWSLPNDLDNHLFVQHALKSATCIVASSKRHGPYHWTTYSKLEEMEKWGESDKGLSSHSTVLCGESSS